jgi:glycosyltransferase involved in cell wall biosynthesis
MKKSGLSKNILLIAYQFCPKGQIGTRRWSKFAKYLSRRGYTVHVLCAKYPYRDKVNWCHDVENNPKIIIHRIQPAYPIFLLQPKRTFLIKVLDRLFSYSLFYMDAAQRWGSIMRKKAIRLIREENIEQVIVTGGPFTPMYQASKIKKVCPDIQLTIDFRDPWSTWISDKTGWQRFRKRQAEKMEKYAFRLIDKALFTTQQLKEDYAQLYSEAAHKFFVLYNGFDQDDFHHINAKQPDNFHFVYTGSLTKERAIALKPLIKAMAQSEHPRIKEKMSIHIYGNDFQIPTFSDPVHRELFTNKVKHCGVVSQQELFQLLSEYEFGLSINAPEHANLIGAKTFDYMGLGLKIFLISPDGELKDMLDKQNQYTTNYDVDDIRSCLEKMAKDSETQEQNKDSQPDYSQFDYKVLTNQLESII